MRQRSGFYFFTIHYSLFTKLRIRDFWKVKGNSEEVIGVFARLCLALFVLQWYNDFKEGGNIMADSPLIIKSKEFALQIIKVCNYVKQTKKESVLTNQLIRSGTSVGANIREAFYGHGTADYFHKYC